MAQLKDIIVSGSSRLIGDTFVNKIQLNQINARSNSSSNVYSLGDTGQVLTTDGTKVYWGEGGGGTVTPTWDNEAEKGPNLILTTSLASTSANIPVATTENSGVISTYKQDIGGVKTFWDKVIIGKSAVNNNNQVETLEGTTIDNTANIYLSHTKPSIIFQHNSTSDTAVKIIASTANAIQITPRLLVGASAESFSQTSVSDIPNFACVINNSSSTDKGIYIKGDSTIYNSQLISFFQDTGTGTTTNNIFSGYNNTTAIYGLKYTRNGTTTSITELSLGNDARTNGDNAAGKITFYNFSTAANSTAGSALIGKYDLLGSTSRNYVEAEYFKGTQVWGAVWNDYAEFRETKETIEPGRCIIETGNGDLILSTGRLQNGAEIVSDTYGFAIGQSKKCNTPIASNGRVLAYLYEDEEDARKHIGQPVCSGPNGTVSIMTNQEARDYPWKIIGTISEIPNYDKWQVGNLEQDEFINVNGRIWIRVR